LACLERDAGLFRKLFQKLEHSFLLCLVGNPLIEPRVDIVGNLLDWPVAGSVWIDSNLAFGEQGRRSNDE
jgi:hypothetical protein